MTFISRAKQIKKSLRQRQLKTTTSKINVSLNVLCTFLLFKASAFLQTFSPRNLLFRQVLRMSVFLNSKGLIFLYLRISLLNNIHYKHQIEHFFLLTNQFVFFN